MAKAGVAETGTWDPEKEQPVALQEAGIKPVVLAASCSGLDCRNGGCKAKWGHGEGP